MTRIERLDPNDDARFAEFHRVYATAHDGQWDRPYSARELRAMLLDSYGFVTQAGLLGRAADGSPVGVGIVEIPLKDNPELAYLELWVEPQYRRAGHGTAILAALIDAARERGRTTAYAEARWDEAGADRGNCMFAAAQGFHLNLVDAHRVLPLPAAPPDAPARDGYVLRGWRGACPDEWVDEYANLLALITQEAPSGELKLENEFYDAARVRANEDLLARVGRQMHVSVALSPQGALAGHTQLVFSEPPQTDAFQWDTLVLPEHRGHGLGFALKAHAMTAARDLLAGRTYIHTYNAVSNAPMIAVNERLGYRHVANCGEYVRPI